MPSVASAANVSPSPPGPSEETLGGGVVGGRRGRSLLGGAGSPGLGSGFRPRCQAYTRSPLGPGGKKPPHFR